MPTHEFKVTITTGETPSDARDWIEEAIGDAFASAPGEVTVEHVRTHTGPTIPAPSPSDVIPPDCPPNLDGEEPAS